MTFALQCNEFCSCKLCRVKSLHQPLGAEHSAAFCDSQDMVHACMHDDACAYLYLLRSLQVGCFKLLQLWWHQFISQVNHCKMLVLELHGVCVCLCCTWMLRHGFRWVCFLLPPESLGPGCAPQVRCELHKVYAANQHVIFRPRRPRPKYVCMLFKPGLSQVVEQRNQSLKDKAPEKTTSTLVLQT